MVHVEKQGEITFVVFHDNFKVTLQAFIVAVIGLLTALITMSFGKVFTVLGLTMLLGVFIASYSINCTVVGSCHNWAWFLTVVYVINFLMAIFLQYRMNSNASMKLSRKI
jgi:predicted membrane protein